MKASLKVMPDQTRVLKESGPFLRILDAFNYDHFQYNNWHSVLLSLGYAFCTAAISFIVPPFTLLAIWFAIDNRGNLHKCIAVLAIETSALQLQLTFMAFMLRKQVINVTIDRLQKAVDQRESAFGSHSKRAHAIYEHAEVKHVLLIRYLGSVSIIAIATMFSVSAIFPISYAIFDYPPPERWTLPVEMQ